MKLTEMLKKPALAIGLAGILSGPASAMPIPGNIIQDNGYRTEMAQKAAKLVAKNPYKEDLLKLTQDYSSAALICVPYGTGIGANPAPGSPNPEEREHPLALYVAKDEALKPRKRPY